MTFQQTGYLRGRPARTAPAAGPGWSRRRVTTALLNGIPLLGLFCVIAQWPLWVPDNLGLATVNLLVTVTFYATSVFVSAEPGHRLTGAGLAAAAFLWPVNWVNEWHVGALPLAAALEGPLASLLAVWALLRYPAPWARRRQEAAVVAGFVLVQCLASLQVVTSLPQWHHLPRNTLWLSWWANHGAYVLSQRIYDYGDIVLAATAATALLVRLA